jgi:uncharacterized protein YecT (DUF1311 family)
VILLGALAIAAAAPATDQACQLRSNYDFLRDLAFTAAATRVPKHSADLSRLKKAVTVDGADVRSAAYDPATGRLECRMTLRLSLPPAARPYFGGADSIGGPVKFWAEPQEDESGYSVVTEGLGPISIRIIEAANRFPEVPDFGSAVQPAAAATSPVPAPSAAPAEKTPAPRSLPKAGFDCAKAATPTEHMICDSDALAEADRTMSQRYFVVRAKLKGAARQNLLASQRRFLGRRDHCDDEACLVGLYMARAAELGRP